MGCSLLIFSKSSGQVEGKGTIAGPYAGYMLWVLRGIPYLSDKLHNIFKHAGGKWNTELVCSSISLSIHNKASTFQNEFAGS